MGYMVKWGPKGFLVSSDKVVPFTAFTTSVALKSDANNDTSGTPATNTTGRDLQPMSFETFYARALGTDPIAQWEEWSSLIGEAYPLYIGGVRFGPKKMQLQNVTMSESEFAPSGVMLSAKFAITLQELQSQEDAISTKDVVENASTTTNSAAARSSAMAATPSTSVKSTMKPSATLNTPTRGVV